MTMWHAEVRVWLKPSVFDPQGDAVHKALESLGHQGVEDVRIGKYMEIRLQADSKAEAEDRLKKMCDTVLCNPVMETYAFTLESAQEVRS